MEPSGHPVGVLDLDEIAEVFGANALDDAVFEQEMLDVPRAAGAERADDGPVHHELPDVTFDPDPGRPQIDQRID